MKYSLKMRAFIAAVLFLFSILLSGCNISDILMSKAKVTGNEFLFDTVISITIYQGGDEKLLEECFALCRSYEQIFSRTIETSEISQLNSRKIDTVSKETAELIETGLYYSGLSDGAFDITVGSLTEMWDFKSDLHQIPESDKIKAALSHVSYKNISVTNNRISFCDNETKIDLGAVAKGFVADKIKEFLITRGVTSAIINLGGNILCIGGNTNGTDFSIGIQLPFGEQNQTIAIVGINDWSVVTSGIYERYFEEDGVLYHHILDPKTGYPYNNDLLAVSIISKDSVQGDALSTVCFALGLQDGMEFINNTNGVYALFITKDKQLHLSNGLSDNFEIQYT